MLADSVSLPPERLEPPVTAGMLRRDLGAEELPRLGVLLAAPGYGKSVAMAQLADAAPGLTVWLRLQALDGDLATFFRLLAAAMRRQVPDFGAALPTLAARAEGDARICWKAFWDEVAAYNPTGLVIALDDAHHLVVDDDAWPVLAGLVALLDRLPPRCHALLATRRRPAVALARLQARGLVRTWDQADLRFDEAAVAACWAARTGGAPPPPPALLARLEGWPLGLDLVAALPAARRGDALAAGGVLLEQLVAEELLATQPPARRAFMLGASLLPDLEPDRCAALLDEPDAATLVQALVAEQLAVPTGGGHGVWRFPAYLAAYLQAEVGRSWPAARRQTITRRLAADFLARRQPEQALAASLAAGDGAAAWAAAQAAMPAWLARGQRRACAHALDALAACPGVPPGWLPLWHGLLLGHAGDQGAARTRYEEAHRAFVAAGDVAGTLKAIVRLGTVASYHHDDPAYARWLASAEAIADQGRPEDRADLLLTRAMRAEQRGDLAQMRACNLEVLALPVDDDIEVATCATIAALNLTTHALLTGDFRAARAHGERARAIADAWGFYPMGQLARFMLADFDLTQGDVAAAAAFLGALPDRWEAALDWHDAACALTVLGHYMEVCERPREADTALQRALAIFEQANYREGCVMVLERLAALAIRRRHPARALAATEGAGELGTDAVGDMALGVWRARAWHLEGRSAEARAALASLTPALAAVEARFQLARAHLFTAACCRALGDAAGQAAAMAAYEALEAAMGYRFLRARDPELWRELRPATGPLLAPAPKLSAAPTIGLARALDAPAPLTATCFGRFEAHVAGVQLDHWPRRKAKLVLAALLLYRRGLGQLELADLLADGAAMGSVNNVQVNVKALRHLLEPELTKGDASAFVLWQDDRYRLAGEVMGDNDVETFEAGMRCAAERRARDPRAAMAAYDEALAVYHGDLFDDPFLVKYFDAERQQYRRQALQALLWQAEALAGWDEMERAEGIWRRAMAVDPTDPEAYTALIEAELMRGRPERARQVYWEYRKALKARLGIAPDDAFEATCRAFAGFSAS